MLNRVLILFSFILLSAVALAQTSTPNFSITSSKKTTKSGKMDFLAPAGHHFNTEAPNRVQVKSGDTWKNAEKVEINGNKLTATWAQEQNFCDGVAATLYICNDQNTYCVPAHQSYGCVDGQLSQNPNQDLTASSEPTSSLDTKEDSLFIQNDPQKALDQAKKENKPLLIDFFAIWCPPCNQLNEEVFSSPDFEKRSSQFIRLKMDVDAPPSWALKSKYTITGYPTVVLADVNGDEINRIIGFRDKHYFLEVMKQALKDKDHSFEQKKILADEKNNERAAYDVGVTYLNREDYPNASYYLYKASRSWSLGDIRRNKLLSAVLGVQAHAETDEAKKAYAHFLLSSLEWYPRQEEVFDRATSLAKLADDLKDDSLKAKAHDALISTSLWYLSHPKAMKETDYSRGDLYEELGDTYDEMKDGDKAKDAYSKGATEYLKEITKAKLNPDTERGFNLERVYCLWKSGQITEAERLYGELENLYPTEFTFFYQHGRLLFQAKNYKDAEGEATKAFKYSYGDNKLRAAGLLADVYQNEGEKKKALDVLDKTIGNFQLPGDPTIRTHHYYDLLVAQKKKISGA